MWLYKYAVGYNEAAGLPVQLSVDAFLLILAFVVVFAGIHLFRRAFGVPMPTALSRLPDGIVGLKRYQGGARLYHWINTALIVGLAVSGAALALPGIVTFSIGWLPFHEILAGCFILSLIVHVVAATRHGDAYSMWFERRDWRDLLAIWQNFFTLRSEYPRSGKYNIVQKLFHAFLALVTAGMIGTGAFLFVSAEALVTFGTDWMRLQRLVHDVGASLLIAMIIGHIYLRILRANWPTVGSMITGRVPASYFRAFYDWSRWRPQIVQEVDASVRNKSDGTTQERFRR